MPPPDCDNNAVFTNSGVAIVIGQGIYRYIVLAYSRQLSIVGLGLLRLHFPIELESARQLRQLHTTEK